MLVSIFRRISMLEIGLTAIYGIGRTRIARSANLRYRLFQEDQRSYG